MQALIRRTTKAALLASAFGAAFAAMPAMAQEKSDVVQLDDIIVTATRREQRLQDVPVSVTAVSGEELAKSAFREVTDIQYLAPNVSFSATNPTANGGGYQIRGVGTQAYAGGAEQTVGLVVDGVVIGLSRDPGATGFSDVERVEVLRGPQGTLFGKNASAGVIQIVTKTPKIGETFGDLSYSFGERAEQIVKGNANVSLGEKAAFRLSAFHQEQDGAIPNLLHDWHVGDRENKGVRAKLLVRPSDKLSILIAGDYQEGFNRDAHTIESLGTSVNFNAQFARFSEKPGHGVFKSFQDGDWTAYTTIKGAQVQIDYQLGEHSLTSITAWRSVQTTQLSDIDAAPINIFNNSDGGVDSSQFTQEIRLTSPTGRKLEYVVGAYYYNTDLAGWVTQKGAYYGAFGAPVVLGGGRRDETGGTRSAAVFGQGTYVLSDVLKVIAGLRYTNDKVDGQLVVTPIPGTVPLGALANYKGSSKADNVSGRIGLQYQPSRDLMAYLTYATGYKGPVIDNAGGGKPREIDPEHVKSYEAGVKSTLLDGRLRLNGALYWSDFRDFQAQALDSSTTPPSFTFTNAGLMRARGVELESLLKVSREFTLTVNGSYSDAKFKDYTNACYAGQPMSSAVGVGCYVDPVTKATVANYAGQRLTNAPKWTYSIRGSYERPVAANLLVDTSLSWAWRSEAQTVAGDPKSVVDAYGILNLNAGLGRDDGSWRVGIYARNLLNEHFYAPYASGTLNPGGYYRIMSPDAFRTVGASLNLSF